MLRALVILVTTVLILLLIVAGTAWYLLRDETFIKHQLEDVVARETDRTLLIDGPVIVEVGESIRFSASGARLSDAPWSGRKWMAEVGEIAFQVDSRSLFGDRLEIEALSISDCKLTLETSASGERNWNLDPGNRDQISKQRPGQELPVALAQLDVTNCRLDHIAPERTEPLQLQVDTLSLHSDEAGQYSGDSTGTVNATPFRFDGHFGPPRALWQGGPFVQEIDLQLGGITLHSIGSFENGKTGEGAQLSLRFAGPEFLQVTGYLNVPPFSSGPFDATVQVDTRNQTTLLGVDGDFGTLEVTANGEVDRLRDPQRGTMTMNAEGPDLKALGDALRIRGLPLDSFRLRGEAAFASGKVELNPVTLETPRDTVTLTGTLEDLTDLDGSQFDAQVSSKDIDRWAQTWGGWKSRLGAVEADGKLQWHADQLKLGGVRIASGADRARVSGVLQFAKRMAGSRLDVDLQLASMRKTGGRFGAEDLPDVPFTVTGPMEFGPDRVHSPGLRFESGTNRGEVSGDIPWRGAATDFNLSWQASGNNLAQFYAVPGFADWPQDFTSSGSWRRKGQRNELSAFRLQLGGLSVETAGILDGHSGDEQMELHVRASIPDASRLEALLKRSLPAEPLVVTTALAGTWRDLRFSGLTAEAGKMKVSGDLLLVRAQAPDGTGKNRISGNLSSAFLDASAWFEERLASDNAAAESRTAASQSPDLVFGNRPVMGFNKSPIDLDLDLEVGDVDLGNSALKDVRLELLWTDDELRLDEVSLRGANGATLSGFFAIDGRQSLPRLELKFRGKNLMLGLGALKKQDPATYPPMELLLDLQGAGKTMHELVVSLEGRIRMFQGPGLFGAARMSVLFNDFISELFDLLNPFAKQSEYSRLDCSVLAADLDAGKMTISPVIIQTPELTILSEGIVDLATEQIDMAFHTKARKGVGISAGTLINPFIKVGGRLATPAIELDPKGAVITGGAAVATVGLSLIFKSFTDRFFSSRDPCGDARGKLDELDAARTAGR